MISSEKLAKKPRVFKSITGLSIEEFEQLYQRFAPVWVEHERQRLKRPHRKRAIGGGRKYTLELKDQLVMVTCWLRLYLNTEAMGFFFGVVATVGEVPEEVDRLPGRLLFEPLLLDGVRGHLLQAVEHLFDHRWPGPVDGVGAEGVEQCYGQRRAGDQNGERERGAEQVESVGELAPHLVGEVLGFPGSHQPVVHIDAGELIPDGPVDDSRCDRRVDPAGQGTDHLLVADLLLDLGHGRFDKGVHGPLGFAAAETKDEIPQDVIADQGMHDLRMELEAIDLFLLIAKGRNGRIGTGSI